MARLSALGVLVAAAMLLAGPVSTTSYASETDPDVAACIPDCAGKECGDDGCGGSCGSCAAYHACKGGACWFDGGCQPGALPGCGDCTCQTCTCAADPYCCTAHWDWLCVNRCNTQCGGCGQIVTCGDGTCHPGETCKTCPYDCGSCPLPCGNVTAVGCCAQTTLFSCQVGKLVIEDCVALGSSTCGWDEATGRYGCGFDGADPAGVWPLACDLTPPEDVVADVPLPESCQGIEFAGCCDGQTVRWCDGTGLHAMDCTGNPPPLDQCGWNGSKGYYDCGGNGGDPTGLLPLYCPAVETDVVSDTGAGPQCKLGTLVAVGCGDVTWEGCCGDGASLYFCEGGKYLCSLECGKLQPPNNVCGWLAAGGYYDCGGEGADPGNEHPLACSGLPLPQDVAQQDEGAPPSTCPDLPEGGCCEGPVLTWCENGIVRTFDCLTLSSDPVFGAYIHCGTNPVTKKVDCIKKPDPAAPVCGAPVLPEPVPEVLPDIPAEAVPEPLDLPLLEKVEPVDDSGAGGESTGLVIPAENAPEQEIKKKSGGCGVGDTGTAWWPLLALLPLLLRRRRAACCPGSPERPASLP